MKKETREAIQALAEAPVAVRYSSPLGPNDPLPPSGDWRRGVIAATDAYKDFLSCEWMDNMGLVEEDTGETVVDLSNYNMIRQESCEPIHRLSLRIPGNKFVKFFEGPKSKVDEVIAILKNHIVARL